MIERLNLVLRRLGHEPTLDDLRDILWLASQMPPAQAFLATSLPHAESPSQPTSDTKQSTVTAAGSITVDAFGKSFDPRRVLDDEPGTVGAAVYSGVARPGLGEGGVRRVRLSGVPPLPQALAIARALRPLGRRRPSGTVQVLDERATAERIAESGLPVVIFNPSWERWFDLILAVDDVPSLAAWRPAVSELQHLLERHGGFRAVTRVALRAQGGKLNIFAGNGNELSPASLHERRARRLFLVVSDCTSGAWHNGAAGALLGFMGHHLPVAVAQLLPVTLWPNTAVGFADFQATAAEPGIPTDRLRLRRPNWAEGELGIVIPVFPLEPRAVMAWARMVMAAGGAWSRAALLPLPEEGKGDQLPLAPNNTPQADERVSIFRATTLGDAQRLAAYFSVVKPLTLPVMRVVQRAMLPDTGLVALAQVFLGGILQPVTGRAPTAEEAVEYDFHPGVRELLSLGVRRSEFFSVNVALQNYFLRELGQPFSFFAYLEDRLGEDKIPPAALPFALFGREIADRFRAPGTPPREDGSRLRKTIGKAVATSVAKLWRPASNLRTESQSGPWQTVSGQELEQFLREINMIDGKYKVDPATTLVSWSGLPFYQNVVLIRVHDPIWHNRDLIIYYLRFASVLYRLNGNSPPIHEVNSKAPIELNTGNVVDYLKFFCFFVRGEEGPFYILDSLADPLLPQEMDDNTRLIIESAVHPVEILERDEPESYLIKTLVFYSNALFYASFRIHQHGMIEMFDDKPVADKLSFKITAPII